MFIPLCICIRSKQTRNSARGKRAQCQCGKAEQQGVYANSTWKITLEVPHWCSEIAQIQWCAKVCFTDLFWTVETTNPELKTGLWDTAVPSTNMFSCLHYFVQLRYTPTWALKLEIFKCAFFIYNLSQVPIFIAVTSLQRPISVSQMVSKPVFLSADFSGCF